jgi:hypothetical protein
MKMIYINWKFNGEIETVDEINLDKQGMKYALEMLREYKIAYGNSGKLYLSQRPTNDWRHRP